MTERSRLAGFDYDELKAFMSPRQASKALGNCIVVDAAKRVLKGVAAMMGAYEHYHMRQGINIIPCAARPSGKRWKSGILDPRPSKAMRCDSAFAGLGQ